jgi:hypothetical protein
MDCITCELFGVSELGSCPGNQRLLSAELDQVGRNTREPVTWLDSNVPVSIRCRIVGA